jgi:hypothetical protein
VQPECSVSIHIGGQCCLFTWLAILSFLLPPADADGCFKELLPAIQLSQRVTVLAKADVLQGFGRQGGSPAAADAG